MLLDPATTQLLVVHLQPALVAQSATETPGMIEASAAALAQTAADLGMPITFSLVPEAGQAGPIDALRAFVSATNCFVRAAASPFLDPAAAAALAANGRPALVIAGFAAEVAVLHAALDALAAGYRVFVPVDAIGGQSARTESVALDQVAAAGGIITSAVTLISMFAPDFARAPGEAALARLRELSAAREISRPLLQKVPS